MAETHKNQASKLEEMARAAGIKPVNSAVVPDAAENNQASALKVLVARSKGDLENTPKAAADRAIGQYGLFIEHLLMSIAFQAREKMGDEQEIYVKRYSRLDLMVRAIEGLSAPIMGLADNYQAHLKDGISLLREISGLQANFVSPEFPVEQFQSHIQGLTALVEIAAALPARKDIDLK